jgi:cytochrome c oxidase subunit 1/cytochrome c oxidase subunit I+III
VSYFRGRPAGADPWHGPTLEWSIPSPPPEFNFAVIPTVSSAYPNWDEADREADRRRLQEHVGVLERDHEQVETTFVDARPAEIVSMPHESPWPIVLALCISLMFAVLSISKFDVAIVFAVLAALTLLAWHTKEPE